MNVLETISKIYILLFLFVAAFIDYRKKEIPIILPIVGFIPAVILSLIIKTPVFLDMVLGCLIGCLSIILSKITKQAIGYGDGMILICTGAALGFLRNLILVALSLIIAACTCALLMFIKRKKTKDDVAFIPFLLGGYVASIAIFI